MQGHTLPTTALPSPTASSSVLHAIQRNFQTEMSTILFEFETIRNFQNWQKIQSQLGSAVAPRSTWAPTAVASWSSSSFLSSPTANPPQLLGDPVTQKYVVTQVCSNSGFNVITMASFSHFFCYLFWFFPLLKVFLHICWVEEHIVGCVPTMLIIPSDVLLCPMCLPSL